MKLKKKTVCIGQLSLAFNTCREEVMRTQRGGWEREGGRETLLGDGAYILNFNKITGEERVSERDREVAVSNM